MQKVGFIGCGVEMQVHADILCSGDIPGVELAGVSDIQEEKARAAGEKYACPWFTDYREMIEKCRLNAVHVITPHFTHADIAIDAMKSGVNVFSEKPMAISYKEALRMLNTSKETGKELGVCLQNRYDPMFFKVKELLDSGKCGAVKGARVIITWCRDRNYYNSAAWRGTKQFEGGGVLINQALHALDMIQHLVGGIAKVKASTDTRLLKDCIEVEDTADVTMLSVTGAPVLLYATVCYSSSPRAFYEIDCENCCIRIEGHSEIRWKSGHFERFSGANEKDNCDQLTGLNNHSSIIRDYYQSVNCGKPFAINAEEGIKVMKLLDSIYHSAETTEFIPVQEQEELT